MENKLTPNATGVQIFQNPAFGQMRVINQSNKPYFVANEIPRTIPVKLCPELAEIIGGAVILIQQLNAYKIAAGISTGESVPMNVAESSLNLLKESLKTLYDEAYIQDLERSLL